MAVMYQVTIVSPRLQEGGEKETRFLKGKVGDRQTAKALAVVLSGPRN